MNRSGVILGVVLLAASGIGQIQGARYLIVCPDSFVDAVRPLAEWKTSKGVFARIVPLSETGNSPDQVARYVRDAWLAWPLKPEYLLIACSPRALPGFYYFSDTYYGDVEGDYQMEIAVGRFPAESRQECRTMVAKTLFYEQQGTRSDTGWMLKGTTITCEEDPLEPDPYYLEDGRFAHERWRNQGFTVVESLFNLAGHSTYHAVAALNDGRSFITYRGLAGGFWVDPFFEFRPGPNWMNRERMPIFVSATCATVTLAPYEVMLGDWTMRFGDPESLGGAVAFFGTTGLANEVSQYRSAVFRGFFRSVFDEGENRLGPATVRARFLQDSVFHYEVRYVEWTLLGDPELCIWTDTPRSVQVEHDTILPLGWAQFAAQVTAAGVPVENALVCVSMDSVLNVVDTTGPDGRVAMTVNPSKPGTLKVVVTGRNLRPYAGTCAVSVSGRPFVTYFRHLVDDQPPGGNGDSCCGPGETATLPVWVFNHGDSAAHQTAGMLTTGDTLVAVLDSVRDLGTVLSRDSACTGPDGFRFQVAGSCPLRHWIQFRLQCQDEAGRFWDSDFAVPVGEPDLVFEDCSFVDTAGNGNGRLDPEETADMYVSLYNAGSGTGYGTTCRFRSGSRQLEVLDSLAYIGRVEPLSRAQNSADRFLVRAGTMVPGAELACTLFVSAAGHEWQFPFVVRVGQTSAIDPIPDGPRLPPLYWAFDNTDQAYPEHPDYGWFELRGIGARLELGDNQTVMIDLPEEFGPFVYYGQEYDRISVCSNGWLAAGATTFNGWSNRALPDTLLPPMLAVNWDDLYPAFGGGVWYYHDAANHRFVVEWDSIHYRNPVSHFDWFEVLLYDTTRAARGGNCEFTFQYRTSRWLRSSTIGIQDPSRQVAITVLRDTAYHPAAARIVPGRAIKFTTDEPIPGVVERLALPVEARRNRLVPTHVRGTLILSGAEEVQLFDITGRRRRALRPGLNDVSTLSPGVYFVRSASGVERDGSNVSKIIIQR